MDENGWDDDAEVADEQEWIVAVFNDQVVVSRELFVFATEHLPAAFRQELYETCKFGEVYVKLPLPKWVEILKLNQH